MLELKRIERNPSTNTFETESVIDENYPYDWFWELYEDRILVKDVEMSNYGENMFTQTPEAYRRLSKYKSHEFPTKNLNLVLNNLEEFECFSLSVIITKTIDKEYVHNRSQIKDGIVFTLGVNLFKWEFPFSYDIYKDLFLLNFDDEDFKQASSGIVYGLPFIHIQLNSNLPNDLSIENYIGEYISKIKGFHQQTIVQVVKTLQSDTFLTLFNFPEELKVSCKQYLEYFATFLRDLGINATSNLKEEAGRVLFSVAPNDDIEALDKIREALEVYLRLPASPITSNSQEIAIQRLKSQVEYFRSQIRLARAENQLKEATIQRQQVTIIILSENVMIDSMMKPVSKNKTSEKVVKGVEVGKIEALEKYGAIIDLGELFRTMKDWFKKKT